MPATQTPPKTPNFTTLMAGAELERKRHLQVISENMAKAQEAHTKQLADAAKQREEAKKVEIATARQASKLFRARARQEGLALAPGFVERLSSQLQMNIRDHGLHAAYLAEDEWYRFANHEGGVIPDHEYIPRCDYLHMLQPLKAVEGTSMRKETRLEWYRIQQILSRIGAAFHGSDVALVHYVFKVGHNEAPEDEFPPWKQTEIQLVYKPDDYRDKAVPLTGYWLDNDPATPLNVGYTISVKEIRRY